MSRLGVYPSPAQCEALSQLSCYALTHFPSVCRRYEIFAMQSTCHQASTTASLPAMPSTLESQPPVPSTSSRTNIAAISRCPNTAHHHLISLSPAPSASRRANLAASNCRCSRNKEFVSYTAHGGGSEWRADSCPARTGGKGGQKTHSHTC